MKNLNRVSEKEQLETVKQVGDAIRYYPNKFTLSKSELLKRKRQLKDKTNKKMSETENEKMASPTEDKALNALKVLVYTPEIFKWLLENDPKALFQAYNALFQAGCQKDSGFKNLSNLF